ncbi:MAG: hypothetical protein HQ582_15900, partial [Planctomycetes bacterium]|nr:hypothetical protein [Planctomycetota bacterium]
MGENEETREPEGEPDRPAVRGVAGPVVVAVAAVVATLATLAPETGGPGITCDELYHVQHGKALLTAFRQQGLGFFERANIERNFPWRPGGPPVHPPLGNLALASVHHLFDMAPNDPRSASIVPA